MDNQETQGNIVHKTQNKNKTKAKYKQSQKHNTENYNDM